MSQRYHIILIQNGKKDTDLIQQELNTLPVEVEIETLCTKAQLWTCLEDTHPDLIISGHSPSGFAGVEALRLVLKQNPTVPFIFVSETMGTEQALDLIFEGASDCIMKSNLERLRVAVPRELQNYTQHKRAKRQRDKAYQMAYIGHWEFDVITEELYWSDTVKKLHEVPPDYAPDIESALAFYKEGEDRREITAAVDRAIETGESFEVELQIVTGKGNQRWVRAVGEAELRGGECVRIFGSTQDITDRKEIEQKLRDVVEHSTNMFYRHDTEHKLSYVSPQAVDFLGCTPEEAKQHWTQFLTDHPVNKKGIQATQTAIDTGKTQPPFPLQLQKRTGEVLWVRVNEAPITEHGETIAIVGSLTDITEQKELQDLLHRTNRLAKVGSWEIDFSEQEEDEVYWSKMTKELLEVEADYQPTVEDTLSFIEPQSRRKAREAFARAISHGMPYDIELRVQTGKGNKRWIRNIGQAEFNEGVCVRVYGSFQDITDRKLSEKNTGRFSIYPPNRFGYMIRKPCSFWMSTEQQLSTMVTRGRNF